MATGTDTGPLNQPVLCISCLSARDPLLSLASLSARRCGDLTYCIETVSEWPT
jgi:hypothetical protein